MKALRIEFEKIQKCIVLRRLHLPRFSFLGYESLIWQAKSSDISISPEALEALKKRVGEEETSLGEGIATFSVLDNSQSAVKAERGMLVTYSFKGPYLEVPLEDILLDKKGFELLKASVESEEPEVTSGEQEDLQAWQDLTQAEEEGDQDMFEALNAKYYSREDIP